MLSVHALRKGQGYARIKVTTFTNKGQNWSIGCPFALYGSTMHPTHLCGGFWTLFCLVCGLLEKKMAEMSRIRVAVLEGDYANLCGLGLPPLSLQLQTQKLQLSGALWTAK